MKIKRQYLLTRYQVENSLKMIFSSILKKNMGIALCTHILMIEIRRLYMAGYFLMKNRFMTFMFT